jgi:hypothetical protein
MLAEVNTQHASAAGVETQHAASLPPREFSEERKHKDRQGNQAVTGEFYPKNFAPFFSSRLIGFLHALCDE